MSLKEKAERNLKIGEILDSEDFLKLSKFPKEHLCSVIINRLYYGVYLFGKYKLLAKDKTINENKSLGHGTKNASKNVEEMYNVEKAKKSESLWIRLSGYYPDSRKISLGIAKLRNARNKYDYRNDVEKDSAIQDLKSCKKQAKYLMKKLKGLK